MNWWLVKGRNTFYAKGTFAKQMVLMHRFILEPSGNKEVDHVDGNGLNNQRANIRLCTRSENMRNKRKLFKGDTTSKHKGVCWHKHSKKWRGKITLNKKEVSLGYFDDEIEAAKSYDKAAKEYFGEFAKLNFEDD